MLTDTATGTAVPVERRRIGYVFQDARLFPHLSVEGNLRYGQRAPAAGREIGFDEVRAAARARRAPEAGVRTSSPAASASASPWGARCCRSRVCCCWTSRSPRSTCARRQEVLPYLEALRDRLKIPIIYVSHQFEEVLRLATHLVLLDAGKVLAHGTVSELSLHPALQAIVGAELTGAVIDAAVLRVDADGDAELAVGSGTLQASVPGAVPGAAGAPARAGARRDPRPAAAAGGLGAQRPGRHGAQRGRPMREGVLVSVDVGGATVLARITPRRCARWRSSPAPPVWALFKAVSTRGHAFRLAARLGVRAPASRSPW